MPISSHFLLPLALAASVLSAGAQQTLKEAYRDIFAIGVAMDGRQIAGPDPKAAELAAAQFSSITPENSMKWAVIHPATDRYDFRGADAIAGFAAEQGMSLIGHTLVWHSQVPPSVFSGENGLPVSREILLQRMREHIRTVVGRYRGKVTGWDVVNEALADGGTEALRDSPWRRIIGDDFIDHAFRYAREADPGAKLYYNDYGLESPLKRERCVALLKGLIERGVPIDGVGTQSHFHLNHPSIDEVEKTIRAFSELGLTVGVSELDVDVLPSRGPVGVADVQRREQGDSASDPYREGLPPEIQDKLTRRYDELFEVYVRHRKSVDRITFWGLGDGFSWLNHFPIRGRRNHPLLFDRELRPKPAFGAVLRRAGDGRKADVIER